MRISAPVNNFPNFSSGLHDHDVGLGDISAFAAYLFDTGNPDLSFGFGPQVSFPTATEKELGSGKYSLGFANVMFDGRDKTFQYGYLLTWEASVAGQDDRKDVNSGAFQPFAFYQLGDGFYARSAAIWTYDFETDNFNIPLGIGLGKVTKRSDGVVVNAFIEPQFSLVNRGPGQRQWDIYAGVNFFY